ncbi:type 1 fimbria pilin [Collimonas sp. PA-H2]|uniref:fimbrial protein n=1 Tax=Collimonas sp. PA-H2 TaxID=1881062 RepID=UPI000C004979|nr:fimbrial protein [Collimonas sp. PA-H2]PFH11519.1 type 1 fimbria pilin [Collimonas sp. PA-H2]
MKKLLLTGIFCVSAIYSAASQATCTFVSGTPTDGETIRFANAVVQRDAPLGSTIASIASNTIGNRPLGFMHCTIGPAYVAAWVAEGMSTVIYNGEQLFNVGIPGVAMRVITPGVQGSFGKYIGPFPRLYPSPQGCQLNGAGDANYCGALWGPVTFQLVKIGNTGSGTIAIAGSIATSVPSFTYTYRYQFGASTVNSVACSVTNTSIPVPMGNINRNQFTGGVGSGAGDRDFTVNLNCDASTRVNIMLEGTAHSSGRPGMLALSPSSFPIAQGVGLELSRNGTPVTLGQPIATGTAAAAGPYTITLHARYVQTAAIVPGQANSTANFTMTYN